MSGGPGAEGTRTFIAITLAPEMRTILAQELRRLQGTLPGVPWVDPESLHLTLAFLGTLSTAQVEAAGEAARAAAAPVQPFHLGLGSLGTFPAPPVSARVIWAGITGDLAPLYRLQADLARRLLQLQVPLVDGQRAYSPHLTLARVKRPLPDPERRQLLELFGQPLATARATMRVVRITVMKSELGRPAARYTPLEFCPLGTR